ncbi:MAG: PulJ/GspJ family protein, partial [Acidimicrobiia bacterium]
MRRRPAPADGFTLTELLVAITILGIIMGAIGAMITTAFRTSSTVSSELNGSRGPKSVSQYWVPDVERAETVELKSGGCGDTGSAIVTFVS